MKTPPPYKRHPWSEWFRKRTFTLVRGIDYGCMSHGMANAVRNAASSDRFRLSVSVRICEDPERIEVEVVGPSKPKEKKRCLKSGSKFPRNLPRGGK
jgi:hypothetical protein